jgi:acetyl-CoA carboxylase carboxyltransferase component
MKFEKEIEKYNKKISELDSSESVQKQHEKGKLTARERVNFLLDEGSFVELDAFVESRVDELGLDKKKVSGDAVITGFGKVNNRQVYVYSQDFSKMGGSLGEMHGKKIVKVIGNDPNANIMNLTISDFYATVSYYLNLND